MNEGIKYILLLVGFFIVTLQGCNKKRVTEAVEEKSEPIQTFHLKIRVADINALFREDPVYKELVKTKKAKLKAFHKEVGVKQQEIIQLTKRFQNLPPNVDGNPEIKRLRELEKKKIESLKNHLQDFKKSKDIINEIITEEYCNKLVAFEKKIADLAEKVKVDLLLDSSSRGQSNILFVVYAAPEIDMTESFMNQTPQERTAENKKVVIASVDMDKLHHEYRKRARAKLNQQKKNGAEQKEFIDEVELERMETREREMDKIAEDVKRYAELNGIHLVLDSSSSTHIDLRVLRASVQIKNLTASMIEMLDSADEK